MANRLGVTQLSQHKKNMKRQQKINQRVAILESKLLSMIDDYSKGKPVETVVDNLGNEYVWVYIGESTYFDAKNLLCRKHINNHKTDDIFQELYNRMSKHGYVLCKHNGHINSADWGVEGWILVFENGCIVSNKEKDKMDIVEQ